MSGGHEHHSHSGGFYCQGDGFSRRQFLAGLAGSTALMMAGLPVRAATAMSCCDSVVPDRVVMLGGRTWLLNRTAGVAKTAWRKVSGPGEVVITDPTAAETTATVSVPGDYVLELASTDGTGTQTRQFRLRGEVPPPRERLEVVYTGPYDIDSPLLKARSRALIVNWLPHCIHYLERTDLPDGKGGIDNFVEAAKALRGEPHAAHKGYVFSNAYVLQTIEAMCIAQMVNPQGDAAIEAAQAQIRAALDRWIPIVLAAQEPDGYLQTAFTLADRAAWPERWMPAHRADHEGYVAGYFLEAAIVHHGVTGGGDQRLYQAARKLADCWVANIGPGKKVWYDGHQEMEQALIRFGRFVNDIEGGGQGDKYISLARFLMDQRQGGGEYDQSHLPPTQQYEAVGHAVRATYLYSAMADMAAETHDIDYQSAVMSLWDNMVNKKYYVTGGIGSDHKSEGFGPNYALNNDGYCETCSSCGLIFFQYKLNLAYHDARFADLYEGTLYNALLGAIDMEGRSYTYTNPLLNTERAKWHSCPCCISNITRILLMMPTWTYMKGQDALYVNLFVGSKVNVGIVAGTEVEMVQQTNYPWEGTVEMVVKPKHSTTFALHIRVPRWNQSQLYRADIAQPALSTVKINGKAQLVTVEKGYAVITRQWQAGDKVSFDLPMVPQRLTCDERVEANRGRVALAYGPLIYNVETVDQPDISKPLGPAPLKPEWRPDLLQGVVALTGQWGDGMPLLAVPHFARMNRTGKPVPEFPTDPELVTTPQSQVWITATA
ncbi:beta-L-arabinofuranosidase domain-containing protein [Asticcacaulis sp.]|uniref:glycoside hydrolase family 127 protein n=1 Tax=Asticcacaulis sp. TaxID=1872648 RepID=UPI00262720FD|nr:beta-L-arabinofuranosidase domain-containing protein [Asticcacaulis sp.]